MDNVALKLFTAFIIFLVGISGGLIATASQKDEKSHAFLLYGDFFARGIFLGAGLIHLLPDALDDFISLYPHMHYPLLMAVCAFSIFVIQFIEQGLARLFTQKQDKIAQNWFPYLLMVLLSIHSIITGAALGLGEQISQVIIIFLAIIAHKGAASFALAISMRKNNIPRATISRIIFLFALMTPIGIFLGTSIMDQLQAQEGILAQSLFNAIAAGTFLYIAMFQQNNLELENPNRVGMTKILSFGSGIALMALVAFWL